MINKPFKKMFKNNQEILKRLNIDLNSRPSNLNKDIYFKITQEYENLIN